MPAPHQPLMQRLIHSLPGRKRGVAPPAGPERAAPRQPAGPAVPPVVLVTDIPFWENTIGSHLRIQGLARVLSAIAPLHVFFLRSVHYRIEQSFAALGLPGARLVSYKGWSGRKLAVPSHLAKMDFFHDKAVDDFASALAAYLQETPAHAVVVEYIRLAYLRDACPNGVTTILDMHDVMSERMLSLARAGLKASIQIDAPSERRILGAFDLALTISRADDRHLRQAMGLSNALYLPYSVPAPRRVARTGDGRRLLFLGGNTAPNVTGLRWFLDQVWPLVAQSGFRLDVVGLVGDAFAAEIGRKDWQNITWHGQQDDLSPFLDAADIAVNPVFVGGGLKIKCLDALACGLPMVTTEEGAAGLEHALGAGLFVARSRQEFLGRLLHLADAPAERRIIGDLACRFVEQEFSDPAALAALSQHLAPDVTTIPAGMAQEG